MTAVQSPIISTHRGKRVVLSRQRVSPHRLGVARLDAAKFLTALRAFPAATDRDWIAAAAAQCGGNFTEMGNDTVGCCVIADGPGHDTQVWTANNGTMVTPPASVVLAAYSKLFGYVPGKPETDQGGIESVVVTAWESGIDGFAKLDLAVDIDPRDLDAVHRGVERYGSVYGGVELPLSAQNEVVWQVDLAAGPNAAPGSWGGHAASVYAQALAAKRLSTITWGMRQDLTEDFWTAYFDEARILFCSQLWCPGGKSPLGDTIETLMGGLPGIG